MKITNDTRAFCSPSKYVQGIGEFDKLYEYASIYGNKSVCLVDGFLIENLGKQLEQQWKDSDTSLRVIKFNGECSWAEIERVKEIACGFTASIIIGVGGGKTVDTAKVVADALHLPLIIVPTAASTDASTSAMAVIYTDNGEYICNVRQRNNPELVLVDSGVIVRAPLRLFVSGMGDALSTVFEARANEASNTANYVGKGYARCRAAMAIAETCYKILIEEGLQAKQAVELGVCTKAVENIIEANILLSGVGFENTGCAAAHGIHAGLTMIPGSHNYYHGEKVAFGTVCQLILENAPLKVLDEVVYFCISVGLPVTLEELGVEKTEENVRLIANTVAMHNAHILAEPFPITEELVYGAILAADAYCRSKRTSFL